LLAMPFTTLEFFKSRVLAASNFDERKKSERARARERETLGGHATRERNAENLRLQAIHSNHMKI